MSRFLVFVVHLSVKALCKPCFPSLMNLLSGDTDHETSWGVLFTGIEMSLPMLIFVFDKLYT